MGERDIGIFLRHLGDGAAPEDAVLEDICLVDRGELLVTAPRGLQGDPCDPRNLALLVDHGVHGNGIGFVFTGIFQEFGFAEVKTAGEFADAEDIDTAGHRLRTQWRGMSQLGKADTGTEIGKESEVLAERKQRSALGLLVGRQSLPLGAADRTEEDRIALLANLERFGGERLSGCINRGSPDRHRGLLEFKSELLLDGPEDLGGLGHDFGSNAISGQYCDAVGLAHRKRMH